MTTMAERLLTVQEVADLIHANPQTVKAWLRAKRLRGLQLGEGRNSPWRIRESALQEFIEAREAAAREG